MYKIMRSGSTRLSQVCRFLNCNGVDEWRVVYGPKPVAACRKFVGDRQAIESDALLESAQRVCQELADSDDMMMKLDNHTAHAITNHAYASRGDNPPYEFAYSGECMTDPKDVTSKAACISALRSAYVKIGAMAMTQERRELVEDWVRYHCGHLPKATSNGVDESGDRETGQSMCYACADARHVQSLDTEQSTGGYLVGEPGNRTIQTWTGGLLMHVIKAQSQGKRWTPGGHEPYERWTIHAVDAKERLWKGVGMGPGMCCSLRKTRIVKGRAR